jgi:hypothetical protein
MWEAAPPSTSIPHAGVQRFLRDFSVVPDALLRESNLRDLSVSSGALRVINS